MTAANPDRSSGQPLRTAAISGLAFTVLYVVHRLLQGTGPDSSTAAAVATYQVAHRGALVASEVAVGLGLLAFIPFLAGLVPVIWRAGQEPLAVAVTISGGVFVAMGFMSNAAETALIWVADSNQPAAVLALDQLQGPTPVVWTICALVTVLSLAIYRTGLVGRWLGVAGLVAAVIFLLGSVLASWDQPRRGARRWLGWACSLSGCSRSASPSGAPPQPAPLQAHRRLGLAPAAGGIAGGARRDEQGGGSCTRGQDHACRRLTAAHRVAPAPGRRSTLRADLDPVSVRGPRRSDGARTLASV